MERKEDNHRIYKNDTQGKSQVWNKLSRDRVTIGGVWIGNWIY
jgi:hypothetical protein